MQLLPPGVFSASALVYGMGLDKCRFPGKHKGGNPAIKMVVNGVPMAPYRLSLRSFLQYFLDLCQACVCVAINAKTIIKT